LLRARFILETERGYLFQHDLIREHVYQATPPGRLRELHFRCGQALLQEKSDAGTLAWHFERAQVWPEAVRYHRLAGERAAQTYAHDAALEHFNRALKLLDPRRQSQADALAILVRRQRVLRALTRLEDWRADVDEIERLATALGEPTALLEALEARIRLHFIDSDLDALREAIKRALSIASKIDDPSQQAHVLNTAGFYLSDSLGLHRKAIPLLERAITLAENTQQKSLLIEALCNLSFAQSASGHCLDAHESAARALATTEMHAGQLPARAQALMSLGQVAMGLARWEQAHTAQKKAIEHLQELGDNWNLGDSLYNYAINASTMGQHSKAIQAAERIIHIAVQSGLDLDSDVGIWYRSLLLRVYTAAGDLKVAERVNGAIEPGVNSMKEGRALLMALTAQGQLRLAQNRPHEAASLLAKAVGMWQGTMNHGDARCALLHAIASRRAGDLVAARASLTLAEAALENTDASQLTVLNEYAHFEVTCKPQHLNAAWDQVQHQAGLFADAELRRDFLEKVRLHQEVKAHWKVWRKAPEPLVVPLARVETPLGRPLTATDVVNVHWTIDAGASDADILRRNGKPALRHHRIRRLLAEAQAQGAAPTDGDLAQALQVSRRTIERDMAALQAEGHELPTRRRKRRSGAESQPATTEPIGF
jgi:tetratricopeptide (TPR) repeat protein